MEYLKKFKDLNLHNPKHEKCDNEKTPFVVTARAKEVNNGKKTLYGCAFNQYIPWNETQIVAAVGGQSVHVYQVPADSNQISSVWSAEMSSIKEELYAVAWCFDTYEYEQGRNPYKIVAGGEGGQIYVADSDGEQTNRLVSIGWTVNDLRTSPTNSNLVACASRDQTVRVFHVRNDTCLLVMGGFHSHRDQILSVDWSANSDYILSCGLDHLVMKWDLSPDYIREHVDKCCKLLATGEINILQQEKDLEVEQSSQGQGKENSGLVLESYNVNPEDGRRVEDLNGRWGNARGCLMALHNPQAMCSDLHDDYVDCVRVLGGSEYFITKACGKEKIISLWRFGPARGIKNEQKSPYDVMKTVTRLKALKAPFGETWFTKFDVDPRSKLLACGGSGGMLTFYELRGITNCDPLAALNVCRQTIRQVSFCPSGRILIAVGEDGHVIRLDRVSASVDKKELTKFITTK